MQLRVNRGGRDLAVTATLVIAACGLAALLAARTQMGIDYAGPVGTLCDCPATPIRALASGRLSDFFAGQPVMGSGSLILRAPFAAIGLHVGSGSELELYRLGAFPCLLAAGLLAVFVFGRMRRLGRPALACALVPALIAVNPLTTRALNFGHPEEILAAALCVGAALAASRRRPLLAGVLIGVAVATKQWAGLAALPVLLAAPREQRLKLAGAAVAAGALFIVPMAIGDMHRFSSGNHMAVLVGSGTMPTNIWFPFGTDIPVVFGANGASSPPRSLPGSLSGITHPLIVTVALALALAWWRRRRDAEPDDVLLLLALIFLVRCLLDPMTNSYYHLPFLMSLAAWEGLRRRGAPLMTVAATLLLGLTISLAGGGVSLVELNRFYLAWTLPFAALLAALSFRAPLRIIALEARSREEVPDGPADTHGLHGALDAG